LKGRGLWISTLLACQGSFFAPHVNHAETGSGLENHWQSFTSKAMNPKEVDDDEDDEDDEEDDE
jgi:hypothetical protein